MLDNGPEFRGRTMEVWSEQRGVPLRFIEPGKPVQNAFAESFHGRLRDECLNANWFLNVGDGAADTGGLAGRLTTQRDRTAVLATHN